MDYKTFVEAVQRQDSRNIFQPSLLDTSFLPISIRQFYIQYNPIDVEVVQKDLNSVRFCRLEMLTSLQKEYQLGLEMFAFATKEGDAVVLKEEAIYICMHGSNKLELVKIADSFNGFLTQLIDDIQFH